MANIALVSVAFNAAALMMEYFQKESPQLKMRNYMDTYLLEKVKKEGGIYAGSAKRMADMLATACEDGADAILLTCTIFSPYAEKFSEIFGKPIICPDKAMLQTVAGQKGKTAILCTFSGTVEITRELYASCQREIGGGEEADMIVLSEAYDAAAVGDMEQHDEIICRKVVELDGCYDNIVLAQISMAHAKNRIHAKKSRVYTSPSSAYDAVMEVISKKMS